MSKKKKKKSKNSAQIAKGTIKEATGRVTGNKKLQVDGEIDQMKGHAKQAGEKIRDALTQ
ncbi:CsbD family protein [mine drainage metagenome]|uniref:CsbD family protein n=1 Tax=mine drainage metagenome TaxID=410659 RepID=T1AF50_9ZZZZ